VGSLGALYPSVVVTSDYRFDGISSSDNHPVLQGSLYWWRPNKTYAGLWASGVDYQDGGTSYEIDVYAGRHVDLKATRITLEAMASVFPDQATPGPTYDFVQAKVKVARPLGRGRLTGSAAFTPNASYTAGRAWRLEAEAAYPLSKTLTLNASIGRRIAERSPDRTFWQVGATATWRQTSLSVRYVGNSLDPDTCYLPRACKPAVTATLMTNLPGLPLGRRR